MLAVTYGMCRRGLSPDIRCTIHQKTACSVVHHNCLSANCCSFYTNAMCLNLSFFDTTFLFLLTFRNLLHKLYHGISKKEKEGNHGKK